MKIFNRLWAAARFASFFAWLFAQIPFLIVFAVFSRRFGIWQMHIFMLGVAKLFGIRFKVTGGKMSDNRPLLLVANHISVFELIAFPALFGSGFFAKAEVKKWPVAGQLISMFGNIFISRNPAKALEVAAQLEKQMGSSRQPFAIFPEGTTSNGNYVLPFKSTIFDFLTHKGVVTKVQPMVIFYRDKNGKKIPPQVLADEYAWFANAKQTEPPFAKKELSLWRLVWGNLTRGGFVFEIHVLPVFKTKGLNRKEIATGLYEIISAKFQELK